MNTIISSEQALGQKQVIVRLLSTDDEMQACVRLQQPVWQSSELEVVPHHIFIVAQRIGGQVLGAFEGSQMLGFVLAFPDERTGRIYLHSHMTAVLPEHQNRGIGRQLKLAQRDDALARGIDLIEWTFDPLQLRNAYFNIVRLGVIVRQYLPNVYGRTTSSLDAHLGHESSGTTADLYVVEIPDEVRRTQERYAAEIDALGAPNKPPKAKRKPPVRKRSTAKMDASYRAAWP